MNGRRWKVALAPTLVTLLGLTLLVMVFVVRAGGDPLALARIGTRFSQGDPNGTEGYDGQFVYYIALEPNPQAVVSHLDDPPYRYQRILLPLLARGLSFGHADWIPWAIPVVNLVVHTLAVFLLAQLLAGWGVSPWYALVYGLWVGITLAVRLDLPEPLAYGLVILALWAVQHDRYPLAWLAYGLAMFAKEVVLLYLLAQASAHLWHREGKRFVGFGLVAGLPFLLFQGWLWIQMGHPGLGLGGAGATGMEWIPFMGLWRIGAVNPRALIAYSAVVLPFVVFPTLWSGWQSGLRLWRGQGDVLVFALLWNALAIVFLPFSTFREPGGLLRFATGLVLAVLLYAARERHGRALRYAPLWLVLNVFLIPQP